ncbi:MAG: DUF86 domain-containing protein [Calditrichia bacterium]
MLEKLKLLEKNIGDLEKFREKHNFEEVKTEKVAEWALRYGILESIQIVIDLACHLVSKYNMGSPNSYGECIELLHKFDYIAQSLTRKLIGMAGLRNILVHEYVSIDLKQLYDLLDNVDDFKEFAEQIKDYM